MKIFLNPNTDKEGRCEAPRGYTLAKNAKEAVDLMNDTGAEELVMSSLDDAAHFVLRWLESHPEATPNLITNTIKLSWSEHKKNDEFNNKIIDLMKNKGS